MPATDGIWRVESRGVVRYWPIGGAVNASVILGLALGVFLVARRAMGAITSPLSPQLLILTAAGLLLWIVFLHLIAGELRSPASLFTKWLPSLTLLLFAVGCSYPGNRWIDWLVWLPSLVVLGWLWALRPARRSSPAISSPATADEILQQLTRYRMANGREAIRGTLVAEFAVGERNAMLYVAFCPPFETMPLVEAEISGDSPAGVKVAQQLHNGAQLDVRLLQPSDRQQRITIELFAAEPDPNDTSGPALAV